MINFAVAGYRAVVSGLLILHETKEAIIQQKLGYDRTVFLPSLTVTLAEVYSKTKQVLQDDCEALLGKIDYDSVDDNLSQIVASFAVKCNAGRAVSLGIPRSPSLSSLLRHYVEDFPAAVKKGIVLREEGELARTFGDARIVLVTGASRGIGRAVAIALAKEWGTGVSLVLAARSQDSLSDVEAGAIFFIRSSMVNIYNNQVFVQPVEILVRWLSVYRQTCEARRASNHYLQLWKQSLVALIFCLTTRAYPWRRLPSKTLKRLNGSKFST